MLGTESVARLLGLRLNHPQGQDQLELLPNQPATRAEAAYSLARALKLSAGQITWVDTLSQTFSVPEIGEWQTDGADAGIALRRLSVRLGRHVRVDAEALELHCTRRNRDPPGRLRLLWFRLAGVQDEAVSRARRCSATC